MPRLFAGYWNCFVLALWNKTRLCPEFFIFISVFPAIERELRVNIDTLLESFRHVVEPTTRMQQEKKIIEFTDIGSEEERGKESTRKRMAHNRIERWDFILGLTAFTVNITENRRARSSMVETFYNSLDI